jgi:nucleoside-diphosphate-sugar epimerase
VKVLVTGATGFIGSHVADKLLAKGYDVRCIARKTSNLRWLDGKNFEIVEASLDNPESLIKAVEGVDYVYHVAGLTFARNYEEFLKGNRDATANLISVVEKHAPNIKRFLFVSSQTVAGPAKSLYEPVDETTPRNPITSYGRSKKEAEDVVLSYKDKIPFTIVRAPAVYGPRDTAIYDIFRTVKMGLGTMVGFRDKYISLIHSEDLSRGIIEAAESEKTKDEIYFVSSEEFYTWKQLINIIAEKMNKKFVLKIRLPHFIVLTVAAISEFLGKFSDKPPVFNYEKGIDFIQDYWICSTEKAKRDFGYRQMMSIEDGMQNTIEWYKQNKWL